VKRLLPASILLLLVPVLSLLTPNFQLNVAPTPWPMSSQVTCFTTVYLNESDLDCVVVGQVIPTAVPTPTRPPILPTATPVVVVSPQVVNGSFESGATGWSSFTIWTSENLVPELAEQRKSLGHSPLSVHSGDAAVRLMGNYYCYISGVYQQISIPAGTRFRFSAWTRTLASNSSSALESDRNVYARVRVGIDPIGGTDPTNTGIRWVENIGGVLWRETTVEAVALSDTVTVFVAGVLGARGGGSCEWPLAYMLSYFDDARLQVIR